MTRRLRAERCPACAQPPVLCVCALLVPLEHETPVRVLAHFKEVVRPSHSARLLPLVLKNAQVLVRGAQSGAEERGLEVPRDALLLFPEGEVEVLDPQRHRGRTLVVPDGSWPQARRAVRREPALAGLKRVALPPGPPPRHRLREHPQADHLATFEAVARALVLLEGPHLEAPLNAAWDAFSAAVLRTRQGGV